MSTVAPASPQLDFSRPFAYVFDDPNWVQKILIGGLFYLAGIFIVGWFFLFGYVAQTTRNIIAGVPHPLPEWNDLGGFFAEGLRVAGVWLVYMLPLFLVFIGLMVPTTILGAIGGSQENEAAEAMAGLFMGCIYCLMLPIGLAFAFWLPAAMLRVAVKQRFSAGFEFGAIWAFIRGNVGNYLLAVLVMFIARFVGGAGVMLFCIGVIFTAFWAFLISAHAYAQVWMLSPVHES
ncbi:MAG TPA: DUF4013 domain-containing protein [Thermoanaerobaculia bacterium]